jgi:glycosyltransferase involved in cell wall biosynthesis
VKLLTTLTYYFPYVSGVTIYAQRLAEALAKRGHQVTVLTSQAKPELDREQVLNQVKIIRCPVVFEIGKGVLMPSWLFRGSQLLKNHQVLLTHLPQVEALPLVILARLRGKKVIAVYHCDLVLPKSFFNLIQQVLVWLANFLICFLAGKIVSYTRDYGLSSPLLKLFKKKLVFILPPVIVARPRKRDQEIFKTIIAKRKDEVLIGFAGRLAAEKGVEYLFESIPFLLKQGLSPKIIIAGPEKEVVGETDYLRRIRKLSQKYQDRIVFLGNLDQQQMAAFYQQIDLLVLPSLNRTESFGLVQAEAMLFGVPVVASNLPGVRVPIRLTGMGEVASPADADFLAETIIKVLENKSRYQKSRKKITEIFSFQKTVLAYEELFQKTNLY